MEVKATEQDPLIYQTQLLTYLRLTGIHLGLLINFGKRPVAGRSNKRQGLEKFKS